MTTYKPIDKRAATGMIGEGIHTGFRKAVDSDESAVVWRAIHDLPSGEWNTVLSFLVDGLESMGYVLCAKVEDEEGPAEAGPPSPR